MNRKEKSRKYTIKNILSSFLAIILMASIVALSKPVEASAFSLKGAFKSVTNSIKKAVDSVKNVIDTSTSKTVYNYSELSSFLSNVFSGTDLTVKLGADITIPSGSRIVSCLHNVDMDMNGHKIISSTTDYPIFISYGRTWKIKNGSIIQNTGASTGVFYVSAGDLFVNNVTIKSNNANNATTAVYINGVLASPKAEFNNCTFENFTTAFNMSYDSRAILNSCQIKNSQGNAVYLAYNYFSGNQCRFTMNGGSIKYSKGHGIYSDGAAYLTSASKNQICLDNVEISGGTSRGRYGIYAGDNSEFYLTNCRIKNNAGGNIGANDTSYINISNLDNGEYSFTYTPGFSDSLPKRVAVYNAGNIAKAKSDIGGYKVLDNTGSSVCLQKPPAQVAVDAEIGEVDELYRRKNSLAGNYKEGDSDFATVSVNGGEETKQAGIKAKYEALVTLSTINSNPDRFAFKGWRKYVKANEDSAWSDLGIYSTAQTINVNIYEEFVKYVAEYDYRKYTLTVTTAGSRGSINNAASQNINTAVYVDTVATLAAGPDTTETKTFNGSSYTATYLFNKWSDGDTSRTRTVSVTKDESYVAMFKMTGKDKGVMYLGVQEITDLNSAQNKKLLLIYVGAVGNSQKNAIETSSGLIGTTGLPDYSAAVNSTTKTSSHGRSAASGLASDGIAGYSKVDPQNKELVAVTVNSAGTGFDTCTSGYIGRFNNEWIYWCSGGGVKGVGPYRLYAYTNKLDFNLSDVKVEMKPGFIPGTSGDTVTKNHIRAYVEIGGKQYDLAGLKMIGDGLDNNINYTISDKDITFELDGAAVGYTFPEAKINGKEYTKIGDAIAAAKENESVIIVGPAVDPVQPTYDVDKNIKFLEYSSSSVETTEPSTVGVDNDGTVRIIKGEVKVVPAGNTGTIGVGGDGTVFKTDKPGIVSANGTSEQGTGDPTFVPDENGTTLSVLKNGKSDPEVVITGTKAGNEYMPAGIKEYAGETITVGKNCKFDVTVPYEGGENTITVAGTNGEPTLIEPGTGFPVITLTGDGDRVLVDGKTVKKDSGTEVVVSVNPNPDAEPGLILERGGVAVGTGLSVKVGNNVIKNVGDGADPDKGSPVTLSSDGGILVPDGGGIEVDGIFVQVPAATPMNGSTEVVLSPGGKPQIKTEGGSRVVIKVPDGNGGLVESTYIAGAYPVVLSVDPSDGIPVIEEGEVILEPGKSVKDKYGNVYKCPTDAAEGFVVATTPVVYETDDNGDPILVGGQPVAVGGGQMSFDIPAGGTLMCMPSGETEFETYENPASGTGTFSLDPAHAGDGIQSDSELALGAGKSVNVSAGGHSVSVKVPDGGVNGNVTVDGVAGTISIEKAGDSVEIGGIIYVAQSDDTVFRVTEYGVELQQGNTVLNEGAPVAYGNTVLESSGIGVAVNAGHLDISGVAGQTIYAGVAGQNSNYAAYTPDGSYAITAQADGTITIPAGKTMTVGQGSTSKSVKAPEDGTLTFGTVLAPTAAELQEDPGRFPAGGVLVSTTGKNIIIDGKEYKRANAGNETEAASNVPMELLIDGNDVILKSGTIEIGSDADITMYDVANEKIGIKNTSDNKNIKITNPGIVTMPEVDSSVQVTCGTKTYEFVNKDPDTEIAFASNVAILKKGAVELDKDEAIILDEMVIKNSSRSISNTITAKLVEYTEADPVYTEGLVSVPAGSDFTVSAVGSDFEVSFRNNVTGDGADAEFVITKDGNIKMPAEGIVKITENVSVQAGTADIEALPGDGCVAFAVPKGGFIIVNDKKYSNEGTDELVLIVDKDGKVILEQGSVGVEDGEIVYVQGENKQDGKNVLVPIANKTSADPENENSAPMVVNYGGRIESIDKDGLVTDTTYPKVTVSVPDGKDVGIGENSYSDVTAKPGNDKVEISVDIAANGSDIPINGSKVDAGRIVLEDGAVNVDKGSSITIAVPGTEVTRQVKNESTGTDGTVTVGSDANVELSTGAAAVVKNSTGVKNNIAVPASEAGGDYKVNLDLTKTEGTAIGVEVVSTEEGSPASGAGKTVVINNAEYTSAEDGKNLTLSIEPNASTRTKSSVVMDSTTSAVDVKNGTITVGSKDITVTDDGNVTVVANPAKNDIEKVSIPSGGNATLKDTEKNVDIQISVPESENTDKRDFALDTVGNVVTTLQQDDTVIIGGIEYTGTSTNEIKVDGSTGELRDAPAGSAPDIKINPELFDNPALVHTVRDGESVNVGGIVYAVSGGSIKLQGNPDGNPVVTFTKAGDIVTINDKQYIAGSADTKLVINDDGSVNLLNSYKAPNSSVKVVGNDDIVIDGVKYSASSDEDGFTVVYNSDGDRVTVDEGSKVSIDVPAGKTVYLSDAAIVIEEEVEAEEPSEGDPAEGGEGETEENTTELKTYEFKGFVPIRMKSASGSIVVDRTADAATQNGKAVISVTGKNLMKPVKSSDGLFVEAVDIEAIPEEPKSDNPSFPYGPGIIGDQSDKKDDDKAIVVDVKSDASGNDESNTVKVEVRVDDDKIVVNTITKESLEAVVGANDSDKDAEANNAGDGVSGTATERPATKTVVIDLSSIEDAAVVVIDKPTARNVAELADELKIIATGAEVIIDKEALTSIVSQSTGNLIELKVKDESEAILNKAQKEALEGYDVDAHLDAYIESNGRRIHNFDGGLIEVRVKFDFPAGKDPYKYHIYYVDDNGIMTKYPTYIVDGMLAFVTDHFSEYVVVYDEKEINAAGIAKQKEAAVKDKYPNSVKMNAQFKADQTGKLLNVKWGAVEDADGYIVYAAYCGEKLKKVKTVKHADITSYDITKISGKQIDTSRNYKIVVKAYKLVGGKKVTIGKTVTAHVSGSSNSSYTNPKAVKITSGKKVVLKKDETHIITASVAAADSRKMLSDKHAKTLRFISSNPSVASVDAEGKVTAHKAGKCTIYVLAKNGLSQKVKITVSK